MKEKRPELYQELKENYLNSLTPETKGLILSVERKMDKDLFEKHFKKRLIKYLSDNPAYIISKEKSTFPFLH